MALTPDERTQMNLRAALPGAQPADQPEPETDAEIEAWIRDEGPKAPAAPKLNPWAHVAVGPSTVLALAKRYFPAECGEFDDSEIVAYALHYTGGTVKDLVRMVGLHLKDRLAQRQAGAPRKDDSRGRATAIAGAQARAEAAAAELAGLDS